MTANVSKYKAFGWLSMYGMLALLKDFNILSPKNPIIPMAYANLSNVRNDKLDRIIFSLLGSYHSLRFSWDHFQDSFINYYAASSVTSTLLNPRTSQTEPPHFIFLKNSPFLSHKKEVRWKRWQRVVGVIPSKIFFMYFFLSFFDNPSTDAIHSTALPHLYSHSSIPQFSLLSSVSSLSCLFHFRTFQLSPLLTIYRILSSVSILKCYSSIDFVCFNRIALS